MADEKSRLAIASSDGIVVNQHFGHAKKFYIYEVENKQINFVEVRDVVPVCHQGSHDDGEMDAAMKNLEDCNYLLVSRIGPGAAAVAEQYGLEVYELPGMIQDSIQKVQDYEELKKLLS